MRMKRFYPCERRKKILNISNGRDTEEREYIGNTNM